MVKISPDMIQWGLERLKEKNAREKELDEARSSSAQLAYEQIVKRLNNLLELKLSPLNVNGSLMTDMEYAEKRTMLLTERDKYKDMNDNLDQKREEWSDLAVGVFNFAAKAQEKFSKGDVETKRNICRIFGTCLVLNGKTLEISPRMPFVFIMDTLKKLEPGESDGLGSDRVWRPERQNFGVLNDELLEPIIQEMTALYKVFGHNNYAFATA